MLLPDNPTFIPTLRRVYDLRAARETSGDVQRDEVLGDGGSVWATYSRSCVLYRSSLLAGVRSPLEDARVWHRGGNGDGSRQKGIDVRWLAA